MPRSPSADTILKVLRDFILSLVRRDGLDLTSRQLSIFLAVYLEEGPHTIRGIALRLDVSKPAVSRSVDRLETLKLTKRAPDPLDRRSVLVVRTRQGQEFLAAMRHSLPRTLPPKAS